MNTLTLLFRLFFFFLAAYSIEGASSGTEVSHSNVSGTNVSGKAKDSSTTTTTTTSIPTPRPTRPATSTTTTTTSPTPSPTASSKNPPNPVEPSTPVGGTPNSTQPLVLPSADATIPPSTDTTPPDAGAPSQPTPVPTVIVATDGSGQIITLTTVIVQTKTSGPSSATATPTLANDSAGKKSSGMSPSTQKAVIGISVGVGSAILLGGLFFVAWRVWGRKRHGVESHEKDDLMGTAYGGLTAHEQSPSSVSNAPPNPFQSTLESYHKPPAGGLNPSANF